MLFLLIPIIFNPLSFLIVRWLPALYLAAWPVIIQTIGRDALLLHAIVLILFIITCDITRQIMLKLIGFDLISLPAGIALLAVLMSDKGASFLSYVLPVLNWSLTIVEPLFILLETIIVMQIISTFNKWISRMSNIRDANSRDLSSWDPPLTRGSVVMRILVILITIASYLGTYVIIQESKNLLSNELKLNEQDVPIQINQAIAMLVTLQLIAFSATIYRESGILSETAMVSLIASVPIFISIWSYYHLKTTVTTSSTWASYFPFSSLFSSAGFGQSGSDEAPPFGGDHQAKGNEIFFSSEDYYYNDHDVPMQRSHHEQAYYFEPFNFRAFERSLDAAWPTGGVFTFALKTVVRHFTKLINSILGLSMEKLAKYYFGPDFWYILIARVLFLAWWLLFGCSRLDETETNNHYEGTRTNLETGPIGGIKSVMQNVARLNARLKSWLPLSRTTCIKILLILAYAQMLTQQMENKHSLESGTGGFLLESSSSTDFQLDSSQQATGCSVCGADDKSGASQNDLANYWSSGGILDSSVQWFSCIWSSARACSTSSASKQLIEQGAASSKASRIIELLLTILNSVSATVLSLLVFLYQKVTTIHTVAFTLYSVWLSRWRSPIIQRLMQSMLVQIYYIGSLLLNDDDDYHYD